MTFAMFLGIVFFAFTPLLQHYEAGVTKNLVLAGRWIHCDRTR